MADDSPKSSEKTFNTTGLIPFQKGKSGNPGGRPKGLAARVRAICPPDTLAEFYEGVRSGELKGFNGRDRIAAAQWLTDRGYGKTPEVMLTGELGEEATAAAQDLSSEDLKELVTEARAKKTG